ncbi:SIMPL domain-containing protein [Paracoccus sp. (in: a-proteobacteria)]|uniref:SIMPL domain-containing protein n=1 Tax=Paracoccus sp. TaxID=267 RepID=UPI0035ADA980
MHPIRPLLTAATLIVLGAAPLTAQTPAPDTPQPPAMMGDHGMKPHGMHQAPMAQLTVSGQGQATTQPDLATINLGVSTRAATAAEAMSQNADAQTKVIEALKAEGIEARDIQTAGLNLTPMMDYSDNGQPPKLTGYAAQNSVTVRVRDIAGLGVVLDKLIASGANEISGITFSREDMTATEDEARSKAVADARRRAEIMAEAAGMQLGPLMALSDVVMDNGTMPMPRMAMAAEAKMGAAPIEAGELAVTTSVTAVYGLRPADAPQ